MTMEQEFYINKSMSLGYRKTHHHLLNASCGGGLTTRTKKNLKKLFI